MELLGEQGEKNWAFADIGTPEEGAIGSPPSIPQSNKYPTKGSNPPSYPGELWLERWQAYNPDDWDSWSTFLWNLRGSSSGYNTEEWYFDLILDQEMGYAQAERRPFKITVGP
jgi:hypothetical protein